MKKITKKTGVIVEKDSLDKHPLNNPKASDRRWINRRETWDIAFDSKQDLASCDTSEMRRQIVRTATGHAYWNIATGHAYWSIWMTIFKDDADMCRRLIQAFPGTCTDCFNSAIS